VLITKYASIEFGGPAPMAGGLGSLSLLRLAVEVGRGRCAVPTATRRIVYGLAGAPPGFARRRRANA